MRLLSGGLLKLLVALEDLTMLLIMYVSLASITHPSLSPCSFCTAGASETLHTFKWPGRLRQNSMVQEREGNTRPVLLRLQVQ